MCTSTNVHATFTLVLVATPRQQLRSRCTVTTKKMSGRRYDVYDDTRSSRSARSTRSTRSARSNRSHSNSRHSRALVPREERRQAAGHPLDGPSDMFDPLWGMSMFGSLMGGAWDGFERAWGDAHRAAQDGRPMSEGAHFFYESTTETTGADGRVRRESVRTRTGADGRLETKRVVRDPDGRERVSRSTGEMPENPFGMGSLLADFAPFGALPAPPVRVEEVSDEEARRARRRARRRSRGHSTRDAHRVVVEEPDDDEEPVRAEDDRHPRRHHTHERRSFIDRARAWRERNGI